MDEREEQMQLIRALIDKARKGFDCSPQELEQVRTYVLDTILMVEDDSIDIDCQLQDYFPMEWAEAQDEINKDLVELVTVEYGWN